MLTGADPARFAVSAHSYAEAYSTLTRRGERAVEVQPILPQTGAMRLNTNCPTFFSLRLAGTR